MSYQMIACKRHIVYYLAKELSRHNFPYSLSFFRQHRLAISYIARYAPDCQVALSKKNPADYR